MPSGLLRSVRELRWNLCDDCREQYSYGEIIDGQSCMACEQAREQGRKFAHLMD